MKTSISNTYLARIIEEIQVVDFEILADQCLCKPSKAFYTVQVIEKIQLFALRAGSGFLSEGPFFYVYTGSFWQQVDRRDISEFLAAAATKMGVPYQWAGYWEFVDGLRKQTEVGWKRLPNGKNGHNRVLINLKNGTFEIGPKGTVLREKRKEDYLTYELPFGLEPGRENSRWNLFLDRVLPDPSLRLVASEFIALCFTGLKIEKVLMLLGGGANGKSVFFDCIRALLGEEWISSVGLRELESPFNRTMLADKLLNYSSELDTKISVEMFKKLASREPVVARAPYGQPFTMTNYARLAFNANELPKEVEQNEAYFRRFLIIPFDIVIPEGERNPKLAEEIVEEGLEGIFNWVLEGLKRILEKRGFSESEKIEVAGKKFRIVRDSFEMFFREGEGASAFEEGKERVALSDLFDIYKEFCKDNRYQALGKIHFSERLERMGFRKVKSGVIYFESEKIEVA